MHIEIPIRFLPQAIIDQFWACIDRSAGPDACWPWTGPKKDGRYGRFTYQRIHYRAHRLAYAITHGDPGELLVCHHCDNPPCCNPAHLFRGTVQDNSADMVAKGREAKNTGMPGESNPRAKLTAEQVEKIKAYISAGETNTQIARSFGVSHAMISRIRLGKAWGNAPITGKYSSLNRGVEPLLQD